MKWIKLFLRTIVLTGVMIWFVSVGLLYASQRSMYYAPDDSRPVLAGAGIPGLEEVTLKTADGLSLLSWYVPAVGRKPTILLAHGNGGNIAGRAFKAKLFHEAGFGVLLLEYRGYGGNDGSPTQAGLLADGEAAIKWLKANGVAMDQTVFYGESLGTGIVVQLATRHQPAAVVLESPYDNFASLVGSKVPWLPFASLLVKDRYESIKFISKVRCPLFIIHGDRDSLIPLKRAKKLFSAASQPKSMVILQGGDHNDLYDYGAWQATKTFLGNVFGMKTDEERG